MALKGRAFTILLLFAFGITMAACAWESETTIGIDLGTTYSSVGVYRNGKVEIIPNEQGNRVTPSCVAFTDTEVLIGEAAKNQSHLNPERTIYDVKSIIGRKFDDPKVQRDMRTLPYKIIDKDGKPYIEVKIRDGEKMAFSPEQISALVLQNLKERAEVYLGQRIKNVVIAVPAYFNDVQVEATRDACTIAGLHVARVLKEPIAAAIAYDLDKEEDVEKNILVFDLGSSTFGVTVLTIDDRVIQVSAASGDNHLGGQDFDRMVMDYFINLINKKYNKDISQDKEAVGKLLRECKRAKMELGSQHQVLVKIKSLFDGVDFSEPLTKVRFEELNMDLLKKMIVLVKKALDGADLKRTDIHEIVLVGGGTRIPMVRQFLKDSFYGREPLEGVNPEEAVAHGAAIQGWILRGPEDNDYSAWGSTIYLSPMSLGIETVGGLMTTVIARDTHIPTRKSYIFTTYQDRQTTVAVKIYEGERALTKDCRELGSFNLSGIAPARRGVAQIEVTFVVDHNGILHVTALDKATKIRNSITIPNGVGRYIEGKEMRRKIMEAGKFAGEDRKAVARIEGRKKLETFFKTKSSINGIDYLTGKTEVEDEKDLKNALKDVMEWLDELDKKVNDWEDVLGPVLKKACNKSGTTSAIHDDL